MSFFPLLVTASLALSSAADTVKLVEDGKILEGRVVFEGADDIVLRAKGSDRRIARKDIAEIHSLERSLAKILDRELRDADAIALNAVAIECTKAGLAAEAKNFWLRALLEDPSNEAALEGVGAKRTAKDVKVALGKSQKRLADLAQQQATWKSAYEVETTHYVVRSDMGLALVLDLGLALERFHKRFYDVLGAPLELYVLDEAPEVFVYGRASDFPIAPVEGDTVWFAPGINRVHVRADMNPPVAFVVGEVARMVLHNALRRSAGSAAQVPAWTAEGIAQLFACAAPSERFGDWKELGAPDATAFGTAFAAELTLERVFNATANEFNDAPDRRTLASAAYALVHYLAFGEQTALRPGYGKFLREGARGKVSLSELSQAVGKPVKEIESGWRAHVEAQAK